MTFKHCIADIGAGWVGMVASESGLVRLTFPQPSPADAMGLIAQYDALDAPGSFDDLVRRLRRYFEGRRTEFPAELDLSSATEFQRRVWQATQSIRYGEVRTYRWVAEKVGLPRAMRAVGQALGRNPLPIIIPCHRVIASDGGLGGFGGGLPLKRDLLRMEKAGCEGRKGRTAQMSRSD